VGVIDTPPIHRLPLQVATAMSHIDRLRALLRADEPIVAPGCYDALTALLIEQAQFKAAYVSGGSIAYTRLGRPDIGLVTASEVAQVVGLIRERVELPLIVDADTGYGNAINVQRTVRQFERMGASCIQLEDQVAPKRCGHLAGKAVVPAAEMIGRIKAALDARDRTLIMARTDALAIEGWDAAIDRAEAYLAAGADLLFIEAPQSIEQLAQIGQRFGTRVPLLANMVEGGKTPPLDAAQLRALGFRVVIFPGAMVRTLTFAARQMLQRLQATGSTREYQPQMLTVGSLNELLGTQQILDEARQYDPDIQSAS
jgi:2-methylisocitrate lyase-like PEP mutase family enzyme